MASLEVHGQLHHTGRVNLYTEQDPERFVIEYIFINIVELNIECLGICLLTYCPAKKIK